MRRVAIAGHPDRNLTDLHTSFLDHVPVKPQLHPMPVEADDLEKAAAEYEATLRQIAGTPPVLDMVSLGLAFDGHTASLVPGDPVLKVTDRDVAITGYFQGRKRMALTYPILNRAREILWVVTGEEKAEILQRFLEGDPSIPATGIRPLEGDCGGRSGCCGPVESGLGATPCRPADASVYSNAISSPRFDRLKMTSHASRAPLAVFPSVA